MADFGGVRVVVFRIGEMICGANAEAVREILPRQPATPVPGAPAEVAGLVNVRGSLVTVVDGRRAVGRTSTDVSGGSILLLERGDRVTGLVVDDVLDLITVAAEDLADRAVLPGVDPRLVRGVGRRGNESFVLLDLEALLDPVFGWEEDA